MNYWLHEPAADIFILATVLGHGLTRNHCFIDGTKLMGFMAMYVFLGVNGYDLDAPEPEVVDLMLQVAEGNVSEVSLAEWLRRHVVPPSTD
jgi:death-on-curing protein